MINFNPKINIRYIDLFLRIYYKKKLLDIKIKENRWFIIGLFFYFLIFLNPKFLDILLLKISNKEIYMRYIYDKSIFWK